MHLPYVTARITRAALVAHRHSFAPPRFRTSQNRRIFVPISVSLWNDLSDPVFDGVELAGFKSRANVLMLAWSALFLSPTVLSFSSFHGLVVWGWGLWTDRVFSHSPGLAQWTPNNNNNIAQPSGDGRVSFYRTALRWRKSQLLSHSPPVTEESAVIAQPSGDGRVSCYRTALRWPKSQLLSHSPPVTEESTVIAQPSGDGRVSCYRTALRWRKSQLLSHNPPVTEESAVIAQPLSHSEDCKFHSG